MEEDYIAFDRAKLKDAVHFICAAVDPDELGNVKLHKILYFSDMMHFMAEGRPLTGVDYLKQPFGPVARHLTAVLKDLVREESIRIESVDYFGFEKKRYISLKTAPTGFSNKQTSLIMDVIDQVRGRTAREISDLSHNVAWQIASMGERIPYAAVYGWSPGEISDRDREAAVAEAQRLRPLMEEASVERRVQ